MDNLREWLNKNSMLAGIAAVTLVVLAGVVVWWLWPAGPSTLEGSRAWFYDVDRRSLVAGDDVQPPPLAAATGDLTPGAVRAVVIACDAAGCGTDSGRQVLYLYKWPDAIRDEAAAMLAGGASPHELFMYYSEHDAEQLVSDPKNISWVSKDTDAGARIADRLATACGGEPVVCRP